MGTRADFYKGRGRDAVWLGSIAWDGYPDGIPDEILKAPDEESFSKRVATFIAEKDDGTKPEDGWPWPWEDSQTTDFAYAIDGGKVWASCFGSSWVEASMCDEDHEWDDAKVDFPDMTDAKNVATPGSKRSGVMVFRG